MVQNKALVFAEVPTGLPVAGQHLQVHDQGDFDVTAAAPVGGFMAQVLYASLDPYLRHRMVAAADARDGFEPMPVPSVIPNGVIARVLQADATAPFQPGDVVTGMAPVQEYITVPGGEQAAQFQAVINPRGLDLPLFLGALGIPGMTAYSALHEIGQPRAGETLFVSAASGAVGQMVGQLAKHAGLRVLGSVSSDEKVALLTDVFGFDGGFNYRTTTDIVGELKRLAPDGIDSTCTDYEERQTDGHARPC